MKVSLFGYNRKETDDYFNYLNENSTAQAEEIKRLQTALDAAKKEIDEYKRLDELNRQEIDSLKDKICDCKLDEDEHRKQIDELSRRLSEKQDVSENEKLGIIFAVAYRDIENKNKAVSEKIRAYADMMFDRMNQYRNEVSKIVDSVTYMQNRQKEELARLCEEAAEKLDLLTKASNDTVEDMKRIEESRGNICGEIENMLRETANTAALEEKNL